MQNSYGVQVNPKYTKAEIATSKRMKLEAAINCTKADIENCNWFINHPAATPQQIADFTADRAILEAKLQLLLSDLSK